MTSGSGCPRKGRKVPIAETNLLTDDELLHRQCNSKTVQNGRPWSKLFCPTARDDGKLSANRESLLSPKDAYEAYLAMKGADSSAGVWGVTVHEFQALALSSYADEVDGNPAHALVDFSGLSEDSTLEKAKVARDIALKRGRLHPALSEDVAPPVVSRPQGD